MEEKELKEFYAKQEKRQKERYENKDFQKRQYELQLKRQRGRENRKS